MSIETTPTTTKAITDAMTLAEFEALSPQQKFFYDCAQHAEAEAYSKEMTMKMDARAEGLAEGRAEGLAEGLAEGRVEGRAEGLAEGREEGRTEGRQEGIQEGIQEGSHLKALETARNLIQMGLMDEQIAQATGLSIDQVQSLK